PDRRIVAPTLKLPDDRLDNLALLEDGDGLFVERRRRRRLLAPPRQNVRGRCLQFPGRTEKIRRERVKSRERLQGGNCLIANCRIGVFQQPGEQRRLPAIARGALRGGPSEVPRGQSTLYRVAAQEPDERGSSFFFIIAQLHRRCAVPGSE